MSESLHLPDASLEVLPFGDEAVLFRRTDDLVNPLVLPRLGEHLMESGLFADVVATEVELMVVGVHGISIEQVKQQAIAGLELQSATMARESSEIGMSSSRKPASRGATTSNGS
jgi:hypothetical protein